mmetsp:Transcript_27472/g.40557  ORF Transcript_27472/g.40557 Transcript_27472/m.40557 type:complete len:288 (+) Transcript_27472:4150-5013(+)
MSLIHNRNTERHSANNINIGNQRIIRGNQHIKFQILGRMRTILVIPFILTTHIAPNALTIVIHAALHIRPPFELTTPMLDSTERYHDQKGPLDLFHTVNVFQISNDLHRLTESHFIRQNSIVALVPTTREPIDSIDLIIAQFVVVFVYVRLVWVIQFILEFQIRKLALAARSSPAGISRNDSIGIRKPPSKATNFITYIFIVFTAEERLELFQWELQGHARRLNGRPNVNDVARRRINLFDFGGGFRPILIRLLSLCGLRFLLLFDSFFRGGFIWRGFLTVIIEAII